MSAIDILRRSTRPMTDAQVVAMVRERYGTARENASNDDPLAVIRGREALDAPDDQSEAVNHAPNDAQVSSVQVEGSSVDVKATAGTKEPPAAR